MATVVGIALSLRATEGVPVLRSRADYAEYKTSSASSQTSTNAAPSDDYYWTVTTKDGAVWATFAASPTAAAGVQYLIPSGSTLTVQAVAGEKCAVIDA